MSDPILSAWQVIAIFTLLALYFATGFVWGYIFGERAGKRALPDEGRSRT